MNQEPRNYVDCADYRWVKPTIITLIVTIALLALALAWSANQAPRSQHAQTNVEVGQIVIAPTATPGVVPTPYGDVRQQRVGAVVSWKRTVSRLETKEYDVVADNVQSRQGGIFNIGGESVQAHLVGTVIGRTDLSGLTITADMATGDITISPDGKTISVVLPYPMISQPIVDETQTSFNNHTIGWWTNSDPNLWQQARSEASTMLVEKACQSDIAEQTRIETENQVKAIFGLGFTKVFVQTRAATNVCGAR